MNTDDKFWFSAVELARLGEARAIDFPRSERNTRDKAKRLGWGSREVPCKGGKRGYMTEFIPPDNVLSAIHAFLKENPDFFSENKADTGEQKPIKHYDKSDKATALKLKSPEHAFNEGFDPLLMHHVIVAVEKMLKKHGKTIDPEKKADLFFLIHDCCKAAGGMDEAIVERFVNVAG